MSDLRIISLEEVSKHNFSDKTSIWFIMYGKVYDITKFIKEHPGGEEVLLQLAGQDATTGFDDIGHSKDAVEMAEQYVIGKLSEEEASQAVAAWPSRTRDGPGKLQQFIDVIASPTWTNLLIPTTLGIFVYVVYRFLFQSV